MLANVFCDRMCSALFCKTAVYFNDTSSTNSKKLSLSVSNTCEIPSISSRLRLQITLRATSRSRKYWKRSRCCSIRLFVYFAFNLCGQRSIYAKKHTKCNIYFEQAWLFRHHSDNDVKPLVLWDQARPATRARCHRPSWRCRSRILHPTTSTDCSYYWRASIRRCRSPRNGYCVSQTRTAVRTLHIFYGFKHQKSIYLDQLSLILLYQPRFQTSNTFICVKWLSNLTCIIRAAISTAVNFAWSTTYFRNICVKNSSTRLAMMKHIRTSYIVDDFRTLKVNLHAPWTFRIPDGSSVTGTVDDFWVVPYFPKLSIMFQSHRSVEPCVSRIGRIKSLFKYVWKGSYSSAVKMVRWEQHHNKIGTFRDARSFLSSEALRRLFQIEIIDQKSTVVNIEVNLEKHQNVYSREGRQHRVAKLPRSSTKLTKWFAANRKWASPSHIKYFDFICYFIWSKGLKCWKPRGKFRLRLAELAADLTRREKQKENYHFTRKRANVVWKNIYC